MVNLGKMSRRLVNMKYAELKLSLSLYSKFIKFMIVVSFCC
jgi:hypothetical protein